MRYHSIIACLGVPFLGAAATGADADSTPIYNDACKPEVSAFQQASNSEAVTDSRHDLLLCLADDAYVTVNQSASGYPDWPIGRHFQVFAEKKNVKVADTPIGAGSQAQTNSRTGRALAGGALLSGDASSCSCPRPAITRGPADPSGPVKSEGFDVYMTFNLGGVMSEGPEGFAKMKGVLDQMSAAGTIPLTAERQAANVIAQFGDVQNWTNVYDPGALTGNTIAGVQAFDRDPRSSTDWVEKFNAQGASNNLSTCGCPEYRIPLTRSGGDGVPSLWREGQDIFFSTNDVRALTETLLQTMTDETLGE